MRLLNQDACSPTSDVSDASPEHERLLPDISKGLGETVRREPGKSNSVMPVALDREALVATTVCWTAHNWNLIICFLIHSNVIRKMLPKLKSFYSSCAGRRWSHTSRYDWSILISGAKHRVPGIQRHLRVHPSLRNAVRADPVWRTNRRGILCQHFPPHPQEGKPSFSNSIQRKRSSVTQRWKLSASSKTPLLLCKWSVLDLVLSSKAN